VDELPSIPDLAETKVLKTSQSRPRLEVEVVIPPFQHVVKAKAKLEAPLLHSANLHHLSQYRNTFPSLSPNHPEHVNSLPSAEEGLKLSSNRPHHQPPQTSIHHWTSISPTCHSPLTNQTTISTPEYLLPLLDRMCPDYSTRVQCVHRELPIRPHSSAHR
jgi:hypothetical protein